VTPKAERGTRAVVAAVLQADLRAEPALRLLGHDVDDRAGLRLRDLPAHLPRRTVMHWPAGYQAGCGCSACGLALREIGQDISEMLDYEPGSFHVVRHVRPKLACSACLDIKQAAAPSRPIEPAYQHDGECEVQGVAGQVLPGPGSQ
jgi:hypothetical protein